MAHKIGDEITFSEGSIWSNLARQYGAPNTAKIVDIIGENVYLLPAKCKGVIVVKSTLL